MVGEGTGMSGLASARASERWARNSKLPLLSPKRWQSRAIEGSANRKVNQLGAGGDARVEVVWDLGLER